MAILGNMNLLHLTKLQHIWQIHKEKKIIPFVPDGFFIFFSILEETCQPWHKLVVERQRKI